jgi:hypothetical protein
MIRGDMSVTEFAMLCWNNKGKVLVAIAAVVLLPPLFDEWAQKRVADRLAAEREGVNTSASVVGMMLVSAWRSCVKIGINDIDRCSTYEGQLLQEVAAPQLAKMAIVQRNDYYSSCRKFYAPKYCDQLLTRSVNLSAASKETAD